MIVSKKLAIRMIQTGLAIFIAGPLLYLLLYWWTLDVPLWQHIIENQFFPLIRNSIILLVGVGFGTSVLGVGLAWLTYRYRFTGSAFLTGALILPLAIPAYVQGFIYLGILDVSGPFQTYLRAMWPDVGFINARHPFGVIWVMSWVLYPYVYLLTRQAFSKLDRSQIEVARLAGFSKRRIFFKLIFPMIRPGWLAGLTLVWMETLADFGTVSLFGFSTFTTAIYKTWFDFYSLATAAQLSSLLMLVAFLLLWWEKRSESHIRHDSNSTPWAAQRLTGKHRFLVSLVCWTALGTALIVPVIQLVYWSFQAPAHTLQTLIDPFWNSVLLAVMAAGVITVFAYIQSLINYRRTDPVLDRLVPLTKLGYALPGTVVAVSTLLWFSHIETFLSDWLHIEVYLTGTVLGLLLAYLIRFFSLASQSLVDSFARMELSVNDAARTLGAGPWKRFRQIVWPLTRPGALAALLLVCTEVIKELPATLLLRPFGWDTLALKVYQWTNEAMWVNAAMPALLLIITGTLPLWLFRPREEKNVKA